LKNSGKGESGNPGMSTSKGRVVLSSGRRRREEFPSENHPKRKERANFREGSERIGKGGGGLSSQSA